MKIPKYLLYGQPSDGPVDWFLNIEKLAKRCQQRGWKIDLHSHPVFAQVMFILQGGGSMIAGEERIEFKSPCVLIIPIDTIHAFDYESDSDGWVITIAEYCLKQMASRLPQIGQIWNYPGAISLDKAGFSSDMICNRIENIRRELMGKSSSYEIIVESDLVSILLELLRCVPDSNQGNISSSDKNLKLVSAFKELVEEHFYENHKIPYFSDQLNVSPFQLRSACETVVNKSPKEMLEERRLTEAKKDLIFSSKTIEQIAYRLGFGDPSYFTRFFKKMTGDSPSSFRERFKEKPLEENVSLSNTPH